ncbi:MAG: sodium:solute symporter [Rhodobacteraceae bacterium]|nr:sodium:solute symporter [Paracoccaceae bacterium]
MVSFNLLVLVALTYVAALFAVAFWADTRARKGRSKWLRSPIVYTLSLSIYCTAWTFYGAVGYAARSGLEFLTIYLGPTLVLVGWWWVLRKLVHVGRAQRVTSIADLISSRYGKSNLLGVIVTLLAVIGTTPYIALQLQSVTLAFSVFAADRQAGWNLPDLNATALWVAAGLALFTILFGTRNLDVNERHSGVVTAIAVEAVVKLIALLAVGIFVVWGIAGGLDEIAEAIHASRIATWQMDGARWVSLTFLSAAAFLTLPRMFQVLVVENADERQLATASWAFPLYLLLMSLFVLPIAVIGLQTMPVGSNPDLFVLTLPLSQNREGLAMLSFLGGFSSATSMVIVASIALSTMVSNHIIMPLWLWLRQGQPGASQSGDLRQLVLVSRRFSIGGILLLGYAYYRFSGGGTALAAIGLISFTGVAQVLPAMLGGLFWRGATRNGAAAGLVIGFALWAYTLFLPSFGEGGVISARLLAEGPWGWQWLRPQALFGIGGIDPVVHALFWSMVANTTVFVIVSLASFPNPLERLQSAQFVHALAQSTPARGWMVEGGGAEDLLILAQRIMGPAEAQELFQNHASRQGKEGYLPDPTPDFIERLERELAGSVGAATAHAMIGPIVGGAAVSVDDLMAVADETQQVLEYSNRLEAQSEELSRTARQLSSANEQLTQLSLQKDAFLSQISHELRTPMTSIRSFSEILTEAKGVLEPEERRKYATIIQDESIRLTRLLDDLLDLSVLENGQVSMDMQMVLLSDVLDRAEATTASVVKERAMVITRDHSARSVTLRTDAGRLAQVFINLIVNSVKYNDAANPRLDICVSTRDGQALIDLIDNGSAIPVDQRSVIFEKFSRLSDQAAAGSAGLGLAICREIMDKLGGRVAYLPGQGGAAFRVAIPVVEAGI